MTELISHAISVYIKCKNCNIISTCESCQVYKDYQSGKEIREKNE